MIDFIDNREAEKWREKKERQDRAFRHVIAVLAFALICGLAALCCYGWIGWPSL